MRIDSFSKGSVLVDYFVELADVSRDINTQEIKQMFHNALTTVPISIVPLSNSSTSDEYADDDELANDSDELQAKPLKVKESFLMGKFVLDPVATDFIGEYIGEHMKTEYPFRLKTKYYSISVIPKQRILPNVENIEPNSLIPQWAIAVIVIGVGSLLFVVIFGVAVVSVN